MKNFTPVLPTVTFGKTHVIQDKAHDLHIEFHGRAHTAGDVVVFCPQKRVVATGDMILGGLPFMGDSYPKEWPDHRFGGEPGHCLRVRRARGRGARPAAHAEPA